MLTQELLVEIHVLHRQGHSIRQIAKILRLSRNTVRRYLRDVAKTPTYHRPERTSKLEPFKPYLLERINAAKPDWIPAAVLFHELQERGYQGKEGILKNWLRPYKTVTQEPVVRFETEPGSQLQIDFTTINRGRRKFKALVATLGYSRASFVRFSEFERQEDWLSGIEAALHYFGGVPKELLFDNAKCIMIERDAYGDGQHRWNSQLLQMARDYGFVPKACRPYRARTKGKVERFNGYLKRSFITPLAATLKQARLDLDVETANARIGSWLQDVANQRIHGTTGEQPQVRLDKERWHLQPLPPGKGLVQPLSAVRYGCATPVESIQHPLAVYDELLGVRP